MVNKFVDLWTHMRNRSLELLFQSECLGCGEELFDGHSRLPLCESCLSRVPAVTWPVCLRCAAEVPIYPGTVASCPRCDQNKLRFDRAICLGHYEDLLRELVLRMKTDRMEQLAHFFSELFLERCRDEFQSLGIDAITFIPMTPWHRLRRGTNPQRTIASAISRSLGIPCYRLLKRSPSLRPQHELSRAGRFRNVRGGYLARKGWLFDSPHILLVDDVITTGATCSEAARILKRQGASRVTVLAIARTPIN